MVTSLLRIIVRALCVLPVVALQAQGGAGYNGYPRLAPPGNLPAAHDGKSEATEPYPPHEDYWYFMPPGITVEPGLGNAKAQRAVPRAASIDYEQKVVELVNQERWDNGQLRPLKKNGLLDNSSEIHSENMSVRNFFAHCNPDTGTLPWDRMTAAGYSWSSAAENIAAGQSDPSAAMYSWMHSTMGHRETILSIDYREIGVGYVYDEGDAGNVGIYSYSNPSCVQNASNKGPYRRYWTQNFGRCNNVYPIVINREAHETTSREVDLYAYGAGYASQMRFRNEEGAWSGWEPYVPNKLWTLSPGDGTKEVHAEIRNGSDSIRAASDTILLISACAALDDTLYLSGQTTTDYARFEACSTIYAGDGGFHVAYPGGDVTFCAPRVVLSPGFSVATGAGLLVINEVPQ